MPRNESPKSNVFFSFRFLTKHISPIVISVLAVLDRNQVAEKNVDHATVRHCFRFPVANKYLRSIFYFRWIWIVVEWEKSVLAVPRQRCRSASGPSTRRTIPRDTDTTCNRANIRMDDLECFLSSPQYFCSSGLLLARKFRTKLQKIWLFNSSYQQSFFFFFSNYYLFI